MTGAALFDQSERFWRVAEALAAARPEDTTIAETPRTLIALRDRTRLYRFEATAPPAPGAPPVMITHGLVGRSSMTDLDEKRSLIRALLARGIGVYALDWGDPSRADRFLSIDDYVCDYLRAAAAEVAGEAERPPVLLGVCEGGVFACCFAALFPDEISGLAPIVAPIDFHAATGALLTLWTRAFAPDELARLVDLNGMLPGGMMGAIFQSLTPAKTMAKYTRDLMRTDGDPEKIAAFLRMERWLADRPHHPGEAAKQLLIDLYHKNALVNGAFRLDGRVVDLAAIQAPILNVFGLRDHLVPPAQARALRNAATGAPYRELPIDAGHIGVFVSARAQGGLGAALGEWVTADLAAQTRIANPSRKSPPRPASSGR